MMRPFDPFEEKDKYESDEIDYKLNKKDFKKKSREMDWLCLYLKQFDEYDAHAMTGNGNIVTLLEIMRETTTSKHVFGGF